MAFLLVQFAVEHLAIRLVVDLLATLLTVGALVGLLGIPLKEAGADLILHIHTGAVGGLILLIIVGGGPTPLIIAGTDPILARSHLTTGPQMIATIGGATDPTLHMTPGTMTATIEGVIALTRHTITGMIHQTEGIGIQFLEALHHLGGEAIHVASLRREGQAQGEAIHAVSHLDQGP